MCGDVRRRGDGGGGGDGGEGGAGGGGDGGGGDSGQVDNPLCMPQHPATSFTFYQIHSRSLCPNLKSAVTLNCLQDKELNLPF